MDNYNYPMGADTSDAPWNKEDLPEEEIEVTISVTLSKTVKIKVSDYNIEKNEDDKYISYDFSKCDLNKAVENQVILPQNLARFTESIFNEDLNLKAAGMPLYLKEAIADCKDWYIDEMEIVAE